MDKYRIMKDCEINYYGRKLYRIEALKKFELINGDMIMPGFFGGYIEYEENLSQKGNSWVFNSAKVFNESRVYDNAIIHGDVQVYGYAMIHGDSEVYDKAKVHGYAEIGGCSKISGSTEIDERAKIYGKANICGYSEISGNSKISGDILVDGRIKLYDADCFHNEHLLIMSTIYNKIMVIYRVKENSIAISWDKDFYTLEGFEKKISKWDNRERELVCLAIELMINRNKIYK